MWVKAPVSQILELIVVVLYFFCLFKQLGFINLDLPYLAFDEYVLNRSIAIAMLDRARMQCETDDFDLDCC